MKLSKSHYRLQFGGMTPFTFKQITVWNGCTQLMFAFSDLGQSRMLSFSEHLVLTHWCRVTHLCVSKLTIVGSDNGLLPGQRQAIIWTNARLLSNGPLGRNFSEILIKIHIFSSKKMHLKMLSAKWRPFCLGLNVFILLSSCFVFLCINCVLKTYVLYVLRKTCFMVTM